MSRIHILHLYASNLSPLYERTLLKSREHLDPERFALFFAAVDVHHKAARIADPDYAVQHLGWMWGPAFMRLLQLIKTQHIHVLHTHGDAMARWGALLARFSSVPLAVHTHLSTFGETCPRWLKAYQAIAVPEALNACTPDVFVNPVAIPDGFLQRSATPAGRFIVTYETLIAQESVSAPPALTRSLQHLREQYPQCLLRLRSPITPIPVDTSSPDDFHLHILSTRKASAETVIVRLLECITEGKALLFLGTLPTLPRFYADLIAQFRLRVDLPLRHLEERIKALFGDAQAARSSVYEMQKNLVRHLSYERHLDLWRLQIEELIEKSTLPALHALKTAANNVMHPPKILTDDEFLQLLQCPRCHRGLAATVTESRNDRLWHGHLDCACGRQYPILRGIPRLLGDAAPTGISPEAPEPFWQRHFEFRHRTSPKLINDALEPMKKMLGTPLLALDLKAGRGDRVRELVRRNASVIALEESALIDEIAPQFEGYPQVRWVQGHAQLPPFKNQAFDLCVHAQASFDLGDPQAQLQTWLDLVTSHGSLHLWVQSIAFLNTRDFDLLRGACRGLPLPLVQALAYSVAGLQWTAHRFEKKEKGDLNFLAGQWFRLLTHPKTILPNAHEMRQWVLDAHGHDLRILTIPPLGTCFSFRRA